MLAREEMEALLEEAVQALPGAAAGVALAELEGWDSMGMVLFVELVLQRTGATLAVHDVRACESVDDLVALVGRAEPA